MTVSHELNVGISSIRKTGIPRDNFGFGAAMRNTCLFLA